MTKQKFLMVLVGLAFASGMITVDAHDFWLELKSYQPDIELPFAVEIMVGEPFRGQSIPYDPSRTKQWYLSHSKSKSSITGRPGVAPAGMTRMRKSGMSTLIYQSKPTMHTMAADAFEAYLLEEGLESVIQVRQEKDQSNKVGKEQYSRCARALIRIGDEVAFTDQSHGLPLELIAADIPSKITSESSMTIRLLFHGRPLSNALVVATPKALRDQSIRLRTGVDGTITFPATVSGVWLVTSVHMTEAPEESAADWESWWASLTFELKE